MRILGISCYFHDASAALLEDGVLIAAAEEERFTRKKHDYNFPQNAIDFCLRKGNIKSNDLDYVVFFEKPFVKFDRILNTSIHSFPRTNKLFAQSMRNWLLDKLWIKSLIRKSLGVAADRILFSDHHLSHAASSFYCSPYEESAVVTFDGVGEWSTTSTGVGSGTNLTIGEELNFPHSIGLLYSAFTAFLGFEVNEGEYKVMGMAPYGTPKYVDEIWKIVKQGEDGSFWLDPKYFSFHHSTKHSYTNRFMELFGEPRAPEAPFFTQKSGYASYYGPRPHNYDELCAYNQHYADLAASIQKVTEELILGVVRHVHSLTGMSNLCLAGGVALNSVANARILQETPFESIYIQPSAGDGGAALGAAFYAWHCALGNQKRFVMDHVYWGEEYEDGQIATVLKDNNIDATYFDDPSKLVDVTVDRISSGKVAGWFQGRFEWGPRALGNRSILADPRSSEAKDVVNTKIKFREPFRPFAPAITAESTGEYFDLPEHDKHMPARFMLLVVPVKEDKVDVIPAVNHMGTSRIQTVYPDTSPRYHQLIEKFGQATGVPVLMNTSFNVRGEPIVSSPQDALNTFYESGLDILVMGNYIVEKDE
jgi:carbamoyltransferase